MKTQPFYMSSEMAL